MSIEPVMYNLNGQWYLKSDLEMVITALELASGSCIKNHADLATTLLSILGGKHEGTTKQGFIKQTCIC